MTRADNITYPLTTYGVKQGLVSQYQRAFPCLKAVTSAFPQYDHNKRARYVFFGGAAIALLTNRDSFVGDIDIMILPGTQFQARITNNLQVGGIPLRVYTQLVFLTVLEEEDIKHLSMDGHPYAILRDEVIIVSKLLIEPPRQKDLTDVFRLLECDLSNEYLAHCCQREGLKPLPITDLRDCEGLIADLFELGRSYGKWPDYNAPLPLL